MKHVILRGLLALGLGCPLLHAQTVLSTLDGVADDTYSFGNASGNVGWYGIGFYVGGLPGLGVGQYFPNDFTLTGITADLWNISAGTLRAELFLADNVTALPTGPALTEFTISAVGSTPGLVTFAPQHTVALLTDHAYLFALTPLDGIWGWSFTSGYSAGYNETDNGWALLGVNGGGLIAGTPVDWSQEHLFNAPLISIQASAVPEPGTYALGFAGIALVATAFRRICQRASLAEAIPPPTVT